MDERSTLRAIAFATICISLIVMCGHAAAAEPGCAASAQTQRLACQFDLRDDFYTQSAIRLDSAVPDEACFGGAEDVVRIESLTASEAAPATAIAYRRRTTPRSSPMWSKTNSMRRVSA